MKQELKKIQSQIKKLRKREFVIERKLREEDSKKFKKYEGTYWKFLNSYSCPKDDSERWWMYRKVIKVRKDLAFTVLEFQTDIYGKTTIEFGRNVSSYRSRTLSGEGWIQCDASEWEREYQKILKLVQKCEPKDK